MSTNAPPPVETVPVSRLYCSPANPRLNDQAVPHVAASLRRFVWQQPIVARRCWEVVVGNTRLKAALSFGITEVPIWWFDGNDIDAVAYTIADNKTGPKGAIYCWHAHKRCGDIQRIWRGLGSSTTSRSSG